MMNHHMSGQTHVPLPPHPHAHPRRQQEFNPYHHHHPPPQSPIHPYGAYPHPAYYPHQPQQYPPQARWQPQYQQPPYMQHPQPPPPSQYQPRSPMVVSSTPYAQAMPSLSRQPSNSMSTFPSQHSHSPRPISHHVIQQHNIPQPQQHHHQQQLHHHQQQQHQPPALSSQQQNVLAHQPPLQQIHNNGAPSNVASTPQQEQDQDQQEQIPEQQRSVAAQEEPVPARRQSIVSNPLALPPEYKTPYYPSLPWYSAEGGAATFPRRAVNRRRRLQNLHNPIDGVALPARNSSNSLGQPAHADEPPSEASTIAVPSEFETPATSQAPSEHEYNQVSTPSNSTPVGLPSAKPPVAQSSLHARKDTRNAIAVPVIAGLGKPRASPSTTDRHEEPATPSRSQRESVGELVDPEATAPKSPTAKPAPKSWADLVRRNAPSVTALGSSNSAMSTNGASLPKGATLAEALRQYNVGNDNKLSFLEPRGLVNTGNMCYMNSILQVLVFCVPFYNFLDQVRQRTVHSMKSDTPLIDAMILFMREFKVLANAESVDILRLMLPQQQLEQYGDPVIPEYVYDAIRKLDRFNSMRHGHQQDAEEFLGFLLEGLHDECVAVMHRQTEDTALENGLTSPSSVTSPTSADGWLEVGPKQKASITRHAGNQDTPSPITKIFGGHLRSELRVPGLKDSVTLEPYKPLQLDIGAQHVSNIVDALKGLTRTEALTGDFGGRTNTAKKQVFIDTLPPVLILHLKRFQYDNNLTGTQKIWKKVGYPLELEIPKDVFPPPKRGGLAIKGGLPRYRLTSVVYHHGKSAAGGHYTVDVLREDGREWVRMDDTFIRRIRPEDVAEGGAEEDPKLLARALEQHKADQELQKQRNIFQGLDEADEGSKAAEDKPWSEVNGNASSSTGLGHHSHKKWSSIATTTGTETPTSAGKRTPTANTSRKENVRDNKVAYILLYERMHG